MSAWFIWDSWLRRQSSTLKLLNAFGPNASDCIERFLMPHGGRKLAIMLSLNEITGRPNSFSPEIKLTVFTSAASNLKLALMRRHASAEGHYYYNKKEVEALRVMDPSVYRRAAVGRRARRKFARFCQCASTGTLTPPGTLPRGGQGFKGAKRKVS